MASFGRRSTVVWGFPDTIVGTAPDVDIVDDAYAAESAQSSPEACTAPKRVIFSSKKSQNRRSMIEKQPRAPKEVRAAHNHVRITGALALISSHVTWMHVFSGKRDRKYRARVFGGVTRHVFTRFKKLPRQFFHYCSPDR